jgi:hypothetical protein
MGNKVFGNKVTDDMWHGEQQTSLRCPKCQNLMHEKYPYFHCKFCDYWTGQDHYYDMLNKEYMR